MSKYAVVKEDYGNYRFSKVHDTLDEAKGEAERLCYKESDAFYVLKFECKCYLEKPVKWEKLI